MQYCCDKCFRDEYLSTHIRRNGVKGTCCLCDQQRRRCLDVDSLRQMFEPLVGMYTNVVDYMPLEFLKSGDHTTLADIIADEWEIFDERRIAHAFLSACCEPIHPRHNPEPDSFDPDQPVGDEELFFDVEYSQTTVLVERWERLREELANETRFFAGRDVIPDLSVTISRMVTPLPVGSVLYRARGCEPGNPHARTQMGAPPSAIATAGRANPGGIAYLYLASTQKTAVSELRPHVGDSLAVGTFKLRRRPHVIDLRNQFVGSPFQWGQDLHAVVRTMGFLRRLGTELSRPIGSARRDAEYLPTQFLCELIKTRGFDGVLYKSGLGDGYNVVLFDPSMARCTKVEEVRISSVEVAFKTA